MTRVPFWDRVDKTGECWVWTWGCFRGYGNYWLDGRSRLAHRVAWELTHGPIPEGLVVCHHCDNPPCVRPDHLFLGTMADNNADRDAKGRSSDAFLRVKKPRGERHWGAKLTWADVLVICRARAEGTPTAILGARFAVHPSTISRVARGVWRADA